MRDTEAVVAGTIADYRHQLNPGLILISLRLDIWLLQRLSFDEIDRDRPVNRYVIAAGLMAMIYSLPGVAEIGSGTAGDCALARDPLRCQALQKAHSACKEKRGRAKQHCIQEKLPAPDCSKDRDSSRCEARQLAQDACKGKTGKAKQSCLKDLRLAEGGRVQVK